MKFRKRKSIRTLHLKSKLKRRITHIFRQIALERGEASAQKVFQVLANWQEQGLILSYEEYPRWGYHDYILHQDGWFISLEGEKVNFQVKSSQRGAQEHLEKYPDAWVIVVSPGVEINTLDQQMRRLFKEKLSQDIRPKS